MSSTPSRIPGSTSPACVGATAFAVMLLAAFLCAPPAEALIEAPDGLVLLDATYPETADFVLENIRALGFDPEDVEYVFVTHGHGDHYGGAARLKEATGARVALSAPDRELVERRPHPLASRSAVEEWFDAVAEVAREKLESSSSSPRP